MARDALVRNLRDGELVISDGTSTPLTITLVLDEGDLSWTESEEAVQVLDRGVLAQVRPGNEVPVEISFSAKWNQLIGSSVSGSGDATELYEILNNRSSNFSSTRAVGEKYTLKYVFTVTAPGAVTTTDEIVTFLYVFKTSMEMGEGDEMNTINFSGTDFETIPLITRGS